MTQKQQYRAQSAVRRFEVQLESGVKNTKEGKVPLTTKDISRINKVIENTKKNILSSKNVRVTL